MARQLTNAKPKNMKKTLSSFKKYIGNHKYAFVFIGLLVILSTSISLWGTYQIKTVVNRYVLKNDYHGLVSFIVLMAIVYLGAKSGKLQYLFEVSPLIPKILVWGYIIFAG